MRDLSCFGRCDLDNPQCIKCKDKDCELLNNIYMETDFFEKHDKEVIENYIDKIVKELEKLRDKAHECFCIGHDTEDIAEYNAFDTAIEIVLSGGKE